MMILCNPSVSNIPSCPTSSLSLGPPRSFFKAFVSDVAIFPLPPSVQLPAPTRMSEASELFRFGRPENQCPKFPPVNEIPA